MPVNITGNKKTFVKISKILVVFNKTKIPTKLSISPVMLATQKRQTTFWKSLDQNILTAIMGYCFKNQTLKDWMSQINSRIRDDFQMLLACFVGYPVFLYNFVIICKSKVEFLFCEIQKQKVGSAKNLHLVHLNNLGRIHSAF